MCACGYLLSWARWQDNVRGIQVLLTRPYAYGISHHSTSVCYTRFCNLKLISRPNKQLFLSTDISKNNRVGKSFEYVVNEFFLLYDYNCTSIFKICKCLKDVCKCSSVMIYQSIMEICIVSIRIAQLSFPIFVKYFHHRGATLIYSSC